MNGVNIVHSVPGNTWNYKTVSGAWSVAHEMQSFSPLSAAVSLQQSQGYFCLVLAKLHMEYEISVFQGPNAYFHNS